MNAPDPDIGEEQIRFNNCRAASPEDPKLEKRLMQELFRRAIDLDVGEQNICDSHCQRGWYSCEEEWITGQDSKHYYGLQKVYS